MKGELLVHIGDPKTGTSSIQRILLDGAWSCPGLRVTLRERLNDYPLANTLGKKPDQPRKRDRLWGELGNQIAKADADLTILSSEQFFRVRPRQLDTALDRYLPDLAGSARVLAYARPHGSRLLSAYVQRSKTGGFAGSLQGFFNLISTGQSFDSAPRFGAWRQAFGPRFTLRPFDRNALRDGDVVSDFLHYATGRTDVEQSNVIASNESLGLEPLAALMRVQSVLAQHETDPIARHAIGGDMTRRLNSACKGHARKSFVHRALAEAIRARYRSDAAALDTEFFDRGWMSEDLEALPERCPAQPFDMRAEAWFSTDTISEIDRLAQDLAKVLEADPRFWWRHYQRRIGQLPQSVPLREHLRQLRGSHRKVDRVLQRITDVVSGGLR